MAADGSVVIEVDLDSSKATINLDQLKKGLQSAGNEASGASGGFTVLKGALSNLVSSGISMAISAITDLAGEAISASDAMFKFEQTMNFAGYDSATIQQASADVKEYADKTVYELSDVANTTAQLAANGIKDFTGLTQAAGNLNAVAGGNKDTFKSVAMVLTQTAGAGKLTTENWNQLANAIPGASGKLQEALLNAGAYTGNFRDAMAQGQITAEEFNAAIMELGNQPVAVEAAASVQTFEGAVGNMQAAVVDGLMRIIDAVGMENITGFITTCTDIIVALLGFIPETIEAVKSFVEDCKQSWENMTEAFGKVKDKIVEKATALWDDVKQKFQSGTDTAEKIHGAFKSALEGDTEGLMKNVQALWDKLPPGVQDTLTKTYNFVNEKFTAIKTFITQTVPQIINNVVQWFSELPGKIKQWLDDTIQKIKDWGSNMISSAKQSASDMVIGVVDSIASLPSKLYNWAVDAVKGFIKGIEDMVGRVRDAAESVASAVAEFLHFSEPDVGPLSHASTFMPDMMKLYAEGIKKGLPLLREQIMKAADILNIPEFISSAEISATNGSFGAGISAGGISIIFNGGIQWSGENDIEATMDLIQNVITRRGYRLV